MEGIGSEAVGSVALCVEGLPEVEPDDPEDGPVTDPGTRHLVEAQ